MGTADDLFKMATKDSIQDILDWVFQVDDMEIPDEWPKVGGAQPQDDGSDSADSEDIEALEEIAIVKAIYVF